MLSQGALFWNLFLPLIFVKACERLKAPSVVQLSAKLDTSKAPNSPDTWAGRFHRHCRGSRFESNFLRVFHFFQKRTFLGSGIWSLWSVPFLAFSRDKGPKEQTPNVFQSKCFRLFQNVFLYRTSKSFLTIGQISLRCCKLSTSIVSQVSSNALNACLVYHS